MPSPHRIRTRRRLGAKTSRDEVSRYTICESRGVDGRASRTDDGKGRQPSESWYRGNLSWRGAITLASVAAENIDDGSVWACLIRAGVMPNQLSLCGKSTTLNENRADIPIAHVCAARTDSFAKLARQERPL